MGNFLNYFKRVQEPEIFRRHAQKTDNAGNAELVSEEDIQIQRHIRDFRSEVTIGKNIFTKKLTEDFAIKSKARDLFGRYFIRFENKENTIRIGSEGEVDTSQDFVANFVECLVESHMSGYIFIGIELPLLKELSKVTYSNLKRLELVKCNIDNIEPITFIASDKFQTIYLSKNIITNIHSFAKTRFPNFLSIQMEQNYITDFKPLTRMMMTVFDSQKKNRFFLFQYLFLQKSTFEAFQNSDLSFLFKVQNTEICIVGQSKFLLNLQKAER